ncbi:hypothetical protein J2X04_000661 [Lysobacter niabensis]|uniref:HPr kinase n=1 Tax=Agrilutibacter niabensis TaxID=380628 RepID=A0ABU1VLG9_9GAMM|nr:hypothetical protein [Lysobacter niabensis]MDR7098314.1 hypothetical protein [Lysobacter niabensis]
MPTYHCYASQGIASEIPLPELPPADLPPDSSLHVALSDNAIIPAATDPDWQHDFVDPHGDLAFRCLRFDRDFYFDFPGIGQVRITPDDRILIWQHDAASIESIRHVLLDQVLPRLLAQRGHLVLHGSAVRTPGDRVLVILGDSGMGKSTLASAFACSGADVLSDDGVLLDFAPPGIRAVPGYPGLRLWPDSLGALFAERATQSTPMSHYNDKRRLAQPVPAGNGAAAAIDAILLLQPARDDRAIVIESLAPQAGCMALTRNSFQLDLGDHDNVECLFAQAAKAACETPMLTLSYPRDYALLPDVIERITSTVAALRPR